METFCISQYNNVGTHYEYVQCRNISVAETYAIKESHALGLIGFSIEPARVPRKLHNDESFTTLL